MTDRNSLSIAHVNLSHGFRGGERQTELLIEGLAARGVKQFLVSRDDSPLIEHLKGTENLTFIPLKGHEVRLKGHLALGRKAEVIQCHETIAAHWGLVHHLMTGVPYGITRRVDDKVRDNFFNRRLYKNAAYLVGVAQCIADYMAERFKVKTLAIHSVRSDLRVDSETVAKLKGQYKDCFVVGHAGALVDRHKGQSVLLEAARLLKDRIPDLKLLFLGRGEDEALLKEKASDLPNAEFLGFKPNITDYISAFDVYAFPSNHEGLGSVLLDVMACGVPVIASKVGGIPELVIDGESGLLVEKQDPGALADAIERLYRDGNLRETLIKGGHAMADRHTREAMTDAYLKLFQNLKTGKAPC